MHYNFYRILSSVAGPLLPFYLKRREKRGKEDPRRRSERLGHARMARPAGRLVWIHAASVGESLSVLPLIERLLIHYPEQHVLLTTGTVTSAKMVESRLPLRALHQYIPVDTVGAVQSFLRHWKPDLALWVESELWPNLVVETHRAGCPMVLVNARMSTTSFERWKRHRSFIDKLLPCFSAVLAQSQEAYHRYERLGAKQVRFLGNLKYDAPDLPVAKEELERIERATSGRAVWIAASTHPGEEEYVAGAHRILKAAHPDLLTILIPRHPGRGEEVANMLKSRGLSIARRSQKEPLMPDTEIYLADTLGELGLFYRTADLVFMGGSLVSTGGHNPLEPARLGAAVITGPYVHNFTDIFQELESAGGLKRIYAPEELAGAVSALLKDGAQRRALADSGKAHVEAHQGVMERVLHVLDPYLKRV